MKRSGKKDGHAVDVLNKTIRECLEGNPYVVGLAVSGFKSVGEEYRPTGDSR